MVATTSCPRTSCTWCSQRFPWPARGEGHQPFIVPKFLVDDDGTRAERNDVVLAGLNHKLGCRGTTDALPNFGEGRHRPGGEPGAVGYLVGEPHQGLSYTFTMMNSARVHGCSTTSAPRPPRPNASGHTCCSTPQLDLLASLDRTTLDTDPSWL